MQKGAEGNRSGDKYGKKYNFVPKNLSIIVFQYFVQWRDVTEVSKSLIVFQHLAPQTEE